MSDANRLLKVEAQINAMAHAWLTLVVALEKESGFDAAGLQRALLQKNWPDRPDLQPEACKTLSWLCGRLDEARQVRQSRSKPKASHIHNE
jgi:hypothetical protein